MSLEKAKPGPLLQTTDTANLGELSHNAPGESMGSAEKPASAPNLFEVDESRFEGAIQRFIQASNGMSAADKKQKIASIQEIIKQALVSGKQPEGDPRIARLAQLIEFLGGQRELNTPSQKEASPEQRNNLDYLRLSETLSRLSSILSRRKQMGIPPFFNDRESSLVAFTARNFDDMARKNTDPTPDLQQVVPRLTNLLNNPQQSRRGVHESAESLKQISWALRLLYDNIKLIKPADANEAALLQQLNKGVESAWMYTGKKLRALDDYLRG